MRALSFFLCALAALAFCGCARETPAERATRERVLLVGNGADPETLDPHLLTGLSEARVVQALFEGLVELDGKTLAPIPAAAASWTRDPADPARWTFRLQPTARWSDGAPVRAQDFVFSLRRALAPTLGAKYAPLLYAIKNARAVNAGEAPPEALGVSAPDTHTLCIQTVDTLAPETLFNVLASPIAYPVREDVLRAHGDPFSRDGHWTRAGALVGNGAFSLARWSVNDAVQVRRNPFYWDAAAVKLAGIRFLPITEQATEERAFRAGQLHITDSVPVERLAAYRGDAALRVAPWLGTYYYIFNTTRPPLTDARVRRALALALDKRAICQTVLRGAHTPAESFVPNGTAGVPALDEAPTFDPAAARALLAQAGYPDGKGFPPLALLYNTSDMHRPLAEALQAMWKAHLNLDIRLFNVSWGAYLAARDAQDFDIARASWVADFNDPAKFLENFVSSHPLNRTGWRDAAYDRAVAKHDVPAAEARLRAQAPLVPLFHYNRAYLVRPEVRGWAHNILDRRPWKCVSLEDTP